jgi:Ran GTPase-activating protein (RanGAP) involved in mRNA processing and transport
MRDNGAFEIADMLRMNSSLKELNIEENSIGDKGVREIASALAESNRTLEVLHIGHSSIFILAATELSKALKINPFIRKLVLRKCSISGEICSILMEGVLYSSSLESLDLSGNSIGNSGAQSIANVLKTNEILRELDISANKIKLTGIRRIAESIRMSESIEKLALHSNLFNEEGIKVIVDALIENTSLIRLKLKLGSFSHIDLERLLLFKKSIAEEQERNSVLRKALRKFLLCACIKSCQRGEYILDQNILRSILFPMIFL